VNIQVIQDQSLVPIDCQSTERLVREFLSFHHIQVDEVAIHFVDTATICKLHEDFFDDPTTTDCISFPMDDQEEEGYRVLGDVFICPETACNYVKTHGGNLYHEMTLYTVHGLLHLLGYDDLEEEDQVVMRREEARYLEYVASHSLWIHE
jgi:probable rRNA maturation factor